MQDSPFGGGQEGVEYAVPVFIVIEGKVGERGRREKREEGRGREMVRMRVIARARESKSKRERGRKDREVAYMCCWIECM